LGVDVRQRADSRYAMIVRCMHRDLDRLFAGFADSIASAVAAGTAKPEVAVRDQVEAWRRLLAAGRVESMSDRELMGFVAEMLFLEQQAVEAFGVEDAVAAWLGPLDGLRDFVFPGREVEVKAHSPADPEVWISGIEQLTATKHPLFLWVQPTILGPASSASGEPVSELVARVRRAADSAAHARPALERRLVAAGWADRAAEGQRTYTVLAPGCYAISGDFPRLDRGSVPAAIARAKYTIMVSGLHPFRTPSWRSVGGA